MGLRSLNEKCHGTWCRRAYFLPFRFRWRALLPFLTGSPFPALGSHGTVSSELENAYPCRVAGTLWRRFLWVMWLACSLVRVRWNISAFAVCSWCSWSYNKVPRNAAEERRRGRNGGTTFRLDSLGTLVYGVNIFLLIEIFTL